MNWTFVPGATTDSYYHTAGEPNGETIKVEVKYSGSAAGIDEHYFTILGSGMVLIDPEDKLPDTFSLANNYPNPFNPSTEITYALPEEADVSIKVYNIMGQEVATLVDTRKSAGIHELTFDAGNLSSGMYIAKMVANGASGEQFLRELKMQLIK